MKTKKWKRWVDKIKKFLSDLLFPENIKCIFCGQDVPDFENKPYCEDCEKEVIFNNGNRCKICAEPISNEAVICDRCQRRKFNFKKAFCPFVYDGKVRNAILGYKDNNERYKAKVFAKYIADEIKDVDIDYITYVPMTPKKEKIRTFNQSKLLAEELGKILGVEVRNLFTKTRDDKPQKFLNYSERIQHLKGMYILNNVHLKATDKVMIVDDVLTTCSTVDYCSGLICNKVKDVYVCGIAKNKLKSK